MKQIQLAQKLAELGEQLPDCPEKAVIFSMAGSLYAGSGNRELAALAAQISQKFVDSIKLPKKSLN